MKWSHLQRAGFGGVGLETKSLPHDVEPVTGDVEHNKEGEPKRVARIKLCQYDEQSTGRDAVGDHV